MSEYVETLNEREKAIWNTEAIFRSVEDWHEDHGVCLFFRHGVGEPPVVTSPEDVDFDFEYFTHFMKMPKEFFLTNNHNDALLKSGIPKSTEF